GHGWMLQQATLNLDRRDVLATRLDHVLETVFEPDGPVLIDVSHIAAVEPAMPEAVACFFRQVQVALHAMGTTVNDLPGLAAWQQLAVFTHDGHPGHHRRRAPGSRLGPLVLGSLHAGGRGEFRLT